MRHTLDVMHVEKNIALMLSGFLLGDEDTIAAENDLQEQGIMDLLHLMREGPEEHYLMPLAPYVLRPQEKHKVLQTIKSVQTRSRHCGNFKKLVNLEKGKLQFMKFHDWHILLEEILLAALRGSMADGPRVAVIQLRHCFKQICAKTIKVSELPSL